MVNFCGNTMWLIRQAIPSGVLEKKKKKKNKDGAENQEAWRLMKSVRERKHSGGLQINELIDPPQLKLIIGGALLWHV